MHILGNMNIVQDDSELQDIMDIKILWSSRRLSYKDIYILIYMI